MQHKFSATGVRTYHWKDSPSGLHKDMPSGNRNLSGYGPVLNYMSQTMLLSVTTDIYKCHKELSFQDWCHRPSHSCASNEDQQGNRGGTPGFVESVSTNSQPTPTMPSKGAFVHVLLGSPARKCAATCPSRSLMVGLTSTSTRRSASAIWQIMKINTKVNKVKLQMT
jgi:hypothetical protein